MSTRGKRRGILAEINVVPYIDVMLVLLVIFMITTPLLTQGVKINLPKAQSNPIKVKNQTPIVVSVNKQGEYFLNITAHPQQPLSAQSLATRVAAEIMLDKEEHLNRPVLIKGDNQVDYGKVVQAMVLLQKSGVAHVGLMTTPVNQTNQTG